MKPFYSLNLESWHDKEDNTYSLSRTSVPLGIHIPIVSLSSGWEGQRIGSSVDDLQELCLCWNTAATIFFYVVYLHEAH